MAFFPSSLAWSSQAEKVRRLPLKDLADYDWLAGKNVVALGAIGGRLSGATWPLSDLAARLRGRGGRRMPSSAALD
jgi:hypothetical protein